IQRRARDRGLDLSYRPRPDGFEARLWVLRRIDMGNANKGLLGGWGIDQRDPTIDRRLLEFCLSVPDEQCMVNGVLKALTRLAFADRLPAEVLAYRSKGYQAVDWHEGLAASRGALREELDRLENCGPAATAIDLARLRKITEDWPQGANWNSEKVMSTYRLALLRAVSVGHFVRRASGSNS
ncbi:MAG: asparagine synthase-related protein, partial [Candidatus Saccharimonadales bacterium]